jgi:carbon-monoxide dehydrogenase medium subunit
VLLKEVAYLRPRTVEEALLALSENDGAAALAGGQSLINVLKNRVASVEQLVDISSLSDLRGISYSDDGALQIGACVTYDELDHSREVRAAQPMLAEVASHIEDQQIRSRGTIGGNCCLSDPTNNLPPLLVAIGATMVIRSSRGQRSVRAGEFFKGYFHTAIEPGELLTTIVVPPLGKGEGAGYASLNVAADAKTIVRAAAWVRGSETIAEARVVLARVTPIPLRFSALEEALQGVQANKDSVGEVTRRVELGLEPFADGHGSAAYRKEIVKVVARRAVLQAIEGARR